MGTERARQRHKRADHPEQKDQRKRLILQAAAEQLLLVPSVRHLTINAVAKRAGLAKGSVYIYYESKNAILIELLVKAVEDLTIDVERKFGHLAKPVTSRVAAKTVQECLNLCSKNRRLAQLFTTLSDEEVSSTTHRMFFNRIKPFMKRTDAAIERRLPGLRPGDGRKITRYGWALLVGLSQIDEYQPMPRGTPLNLKKSLNDALILVINGLLTQAK